MCKATNERASQILGFTDPDDPVAFWLDRAVTTFGRLVEKDIEDHVAKMKNQKSAERRATQRLMKWLDHDGSMTKQRFAAPPIAMIKNKGGESDS